MTRIFKDWDEIDDREKELFIERWKHSSRVLVRVRKLI